MVDASRDMQLALLMGRYQVLRPLGAGGMGTLFLARDLRFEHRLVALKENLNRSPAAQAQFRLEAEVLATLRHAHLPAVTDHFVTPDGRQFLVMDYVEGEDLEALVRSRGPQPERQVLAWGLQVLDALEYLHGQKPPIIHRDVKPANIRITPEGKAVLVDFGIAKYMVTGHYTATAAARVGSPGYAPLEQYTGMGSTDRRTDLYSLGATLYFALTGRTPPEAPFLASGHALTPPRQLNPAISLRTEKAILRAMEQRPEARPQSAAEMRAMLTEGSRPRQWYFLAATVGMVLIAFTLIAAVFSFTYYTRRAKQPPAVGTPVPSSTTQVVLQVGPATWTPLPKTPLPTDTVQVWPATGTPLPTDTVSPGHPTSTPRPTSTPKTTPSPTETTSPIPAGQPRLISPEAGTTTGNPVSFRWEGRLSPGQAYRVVAYHPQSGEQVTSPQIMDSWWETHLPAARAGEWHWYVEVVEGGRTIARSAEGMFWFEPVRVEPGTPPTPPTPRRL
jgi:serine/threonine-protein kinase